MVDLQFLLHMSMLCVTSFDGKMFGLTLERLLAILERQVGVFVVILTPFGLKLNARAEWLALLLKIILISISSLTVTSFLIFLFVGEIILGLKGMVSL